VRPHNFGSPNRQSLRSLHTGPALPGEYDAAEAKRRAHVADLDRQVQLKQQRKARERAEREAADRKLEEQVASYHRTAESRNRKGFVPSSQQHHVQDVQRMTGVLPSAMQSQQVQAAMFGGGTPAAPHETSAHGGVKGDFYHQLKSQADAAQQNKVLQKHRREAEDVAMESKLKKEREDLAKKHQDEIDRESKAQQEKDAIALAKQRERDAEDFKRKKEEAKRADEEAERKAQEKADRERQELAKKYEQEKELEARDEERRRVERERNKAVLEAVERGEDPPKLPPVRAPVPIAARPGGGNERAPASQGSSGGSEQSVHNEHDDMCMALTHGHAMAPLSLAGTARAVRAANGALAGLVHGAASAPVPGPVPGSAPGPVAAPAPGLDRPSFTGVIHAVDAATGMMNGVAPLGNMTHMDATSSSGAPPAPWPGPLPFAGARHAIGVASGMQASTTRMNGQVPGPAPGALPGAAPAPAPPSLSGATNTIGAASGVFGGSLLPMSASHAADVSSSTLGVATTVAPEPGPDPAVDAAVRGPPSFNGAVHAIGAAGVMAHGFNVSENPSLGVSLSALSGANAPALPGPGAGRAGVGAGEMQGTETPKVSFAGAPYMVGAVAGPAPKFMPHGMTTQTNGPQLALRGVSAPTFGPEAPIGREKGFELEPEPGSKFASLSFANATHVADTAPTIGHEPSPPAQAAQMPVLHCAPMNIASPPTATEHGAAGATAASSRSVVEPLMEPLRQPRISPSGLTTRVANRPPLGPALAVAAQSSNFGRECLPEPNRGTLPQRAGAMHEARASASSPHNVPALRHSRPHVFAAPIEAADGDTIPQLDKAQESLLLYDDGKTELLPPPSPERNDDEDNEGDRVVLSGQRFGDPQFAAMGEYKQIQGQTHDARPVYQQVAPPSGTGQHQHFLYYIGPPVGSWSVGDNIGAHKTRLFVTSDAASPDKVESGGAWMVIDGTQWARARRVRIKPWRAEPSTEQHGTGAHIVQGNQATSAPMISARSTYSDDGRCGIDINGLLQLNTTKLDHLTELVADGAQNGAEEQVLDTARLQGVLSTIDMAEAAAAISTVEDRGGTPSHANPMGTALDAGIDVSRLEPVLA
tara:strand:+ start:151 stop:3459 length:3309 start_codon:yes stop_codon:yes gene_type:complete